MNIFQNKSKRAALIAFFVLLSGCSMFTGRETAGEYVDDATITSKVKADIIADPTLKVLQVNVETLQGVVQLSGFVNSTENDRRAVQIASRIKGVKSVKDNLIIP